MTHLLTLLVEYDSLVPLVGTGLKYIIIGIKGEETR
jgi:hypothetical protein